MSLSDLKDIKIEDIIFNPKNKNMLLNIIIILFSLLVANNIYKAQARRTQLLIEGKDKEAKKNTILHDINQSVQTLNTYSDFLKEKDVSTVINTINNIAKDSGVRIVSLQPKQGKDYPMYVKYPFDIVIQANSYHLIGRFISKLESHSDIYILDSVVIKSSRGQGYPVGSAEDSDSFNMEADLQLSTVLFKFKSDETNK